MDRKFPLSGKRCVSKPRQSRKRPGCIRLFVCPTTGGRLEISVSPRESILGLKTALARKLKTNPARITLIHKEKALTSGRLVDYQIPEDSILTLLPNMESGLSLHQSEKSITQALENLSETQVNDFLSGRAPLMLAMRMGENMVFVQLQLSTVQGQGQAQSQGSSNGQQKPSVSPRTATLLSQSGLSASALAQATRCLSRRIHHLQGMGKTSTVTPPMAVNPRQLPSTLPMATLSSSSSSSSSPCSSSSPSSSKLSSTSPVMMAPVPSPNSPPQSSGAVPTTLKPSGPSLLQIPTSNPLPQNLASSSSSSSSIPSPPPSPGAVINSLKHVGSGIYSGTFSGTLDPALQEPSGHPRRSVHTILHILNDLLVASPSSPRPQTSSSSRPASPSSPLHKNQASQTFFNQNSILTPPPSPKLTENNGCFMMEKTDNELLRGKMQRVQMMLAQRKEQRGKRRQAVAPYPQSVNNCLTKTSDSISNCSSLASSCPLGRDSHIAPVTQTSSDVSPVTAASSSSSSSSDRPRICSHVDEGGECCSSYGNKGIEHDSLVV